VAGSGESHARSPTNLFALPTDQPLLPLLGWSPSPRGPVLHCDIAERPELADLVRLSVAGPSVVRVQWVALPPLVGFRYIVDRPVHQLFDVVLDLHYLAPLIQGALAARVLWLALVPSSTHVPLYVPVSPSELGETVAGVLACTKLAA
jgi:hypothetical protein